MSDVDIDIEYAMVMPPGWVRLPAKLEDRKLLYELIDSIVNNALPSDLPRDRAEPWRKELRKRLRTSVTSIGEAGATGVYLPVEPVAGQSISASIIEGQFVDDDRLGVNAVSEALLNDNLSQTEIREVDGALAIRSDNRAPTIAMDDDWTVIPNRQIVYTVKAPQSDNKWLVLSFSTAAGGDPYSPIAEALILLFDALVTTLRWINVPGAEPSKLEQRLRRI